MNVVWFKRDLRAARNRALVACAAMGAPVLPLYVIEPDLWRQPDMSCRQYAFIAQCLEELREDLGALGQPLVVRVGDVETVLEALSQQFSIQHIFSHEETGNAWTYTRDKAVKSWCVRNAVQWTELWQNGVVRRLKSRNGWANNWERRMRMPVPATLSALAPIDGMDIGTIPTAEQLGLKWDGCQSPQTGGRQAGLACLDSFLTKRGARYRSDMSSPLTAFEGCSRLSPYIAQGTLSIQEVANAIAQQQNLLNSALDHPGPWRGSLSSFSGRLHWHCHFIQKLEDEPSLEFDEQHPAYRGIRPGTPDAHRLRAWERGETGLPFVDACMRCLHATGWMNFRMRAMLVSVASYHLWLDWRHTGQQLARLFVDYEPGIHWPQMQMQSGTTGINTIRIYNPVKQGLDQDPDGHFVRQWIPELALVPTAYIHHPWTWDKAPTILDRNYPLPVVDHIDAAKEARQKIWAVRKGDTYRQTAQAIQAKHGSRKSGLKMTGQRSKTKAHLPKRQLSLDLG